MKVPERLARIIEPVRELILRLTPAQRISLVLLGLVMLIGMGMLVFTSPQSARMVQFPGVANAEMLRFLEDRNFKHRVEGRTLFVRQGDIPQLSLQFIDSGANEDAPDFMEWLYKEMSFNDTAGRINLRVGDSMRKSLEYAIAGYKDISHASVFVNKKEHPFRIRDNNTSTASVVLGLEKGVNRVSPRTARTVGTLIAGALGIPLARVKVSDTHGFDYRLDEDPAISADSILDRERQMRTKLSSTVFDVELAPSEYSLVVDLKVNRTTRRARTKSFDRDTSVDLTKRTYKEETESVVPSRFAPGTKPNVSGFTNKSSSNSKNTSKRSEEERENRFGSTEEDAVIPAGEEEKWSILATVSKPAIERLLKRDKELQGITWQPTPQELNAAVEEKLARYKTQLESFPSTPQTTVTVDWFMPNDLATADLIEKPNGALAFLALHVRELVLTTLALFACFLLYRVAAGVPELEALPDPVAELATFLREKQEAESAALAAVEDGEEPRKQEWEVGEGEQAEMELLQEVLDYSKERPEVTANVVRLWMHDAEPEAPPAAGEEPS